MKHKSTLVLIELLVMILVFSLAAALCLQAFVRADQISREVAQRDQAVAICKNAAELLRTSGDLPGTAALLGAVETEEGWAVPLDAAGSPGGSVFLLELFREEGITGLGKARVQVSSCASGEALFTLTVGWQEVLE